MWVIPGPWNIEIAFKPKRVLSPPPPPGKFLITPLENLSLRIPIENVF